MPHKPRASGGLLEALFNIDLVVLNPPTSYNELAFQIGNALRRIFRERGVLSSKALRAIGLTGQRPAKDRAAKKWDRENHGMFVALQDAISVTVRGAPASELMSTAIVTELRPLEKGGVLVQPNGIESNFLRRLRVVIASELKRHPDSIEFDIKPYAGELEIPRAVKRSTKNRASPVRHPFPNRRTGLPAYPTRRRK